MILCPEDLEEDLEEDPEEALAVDAEWADPEWVDLEWAEWEDPAEDPWDHRLPEEAGEGDRTEAAVLAAWVHLPWRWAALPH